MSMPDFRHAAVALGPDLVALRRDLHRLPEVGLDLPATQRRVLAELDGLGLELTLGTRTTSVVAVLRGDRPGPTVLLRADMDALPVAEATALDYRATNGAMHACGHDLHVAGLVGAARLLAARRECLPGTVVLAFQPGEEGWGGARVMLDEGLLDVAGSRPVAAYAVHVGTGPRGLFMTRSGPVLASSSVVTVRLHGVGGHASNPARARDPLPALAELVLALQTLVTRSLDVHEPVVLSVTRVEASEAVNVIAGTATLQASLRTFSGATLDAVEHGVRRMADGIAAAHGLTAEVEVCRDYPVTVTDEGESERVRRVVTEHFGADRFTELAQPAMGSEDFAFVLEQVPGAYLMLGALPDDVAPGSTYPHSPDVRFDDAVLTDQAAALAMLAWDRLSEG